MGSSRKILRKIFSFLLLITFSLQNVSSGQDIFTDTLATSPVSSEKPVTEESFLFSQAIRGDIRMMSVIYSVAQAFFESGESKEGLLKTLSGKFFWNDSFLRGLNIDLENISMEDYRNDGFLSIPFVSEDGRLSGIVGVCPVTSRVVSARDDKSWERLGEYTFFIESRPRGTDITSRDMRGPAAFSETNPILEGLIVSGKVVELSMDTENGDFKAHRVKWVEDYVPGATPEDVYKGSEISVSQVLSRSERKVLRRWMREHSVRGSPVKFRIILGDPAIGWFSDMDHSYIAHAGFRDNAVYMGSLLLRYLLREESSGVRSEILDNDEFRHLSGLDHGTAEEIERRLSLVSEAMERENLQRTGAAIAEDDVDFMVAEMKSLLSSGDTYGILNFLSAVNDVALTRGKYPVESTYPIKHAVALLSKKEQDLLMDILTGTVSRSEEYRYKIVVDELISMLDEDQVLQEWIKVYAPNLEGRSLWQISPEIWHEAGGLARVMQYHGAGIKHLIGQSGVRFRHIEPHYQNRIDAQGNPGKLDYTDAAHITHPIQGELEEVARYSVELNGKDVNVIVSRGVNDLGIEIYLIRDEGGVYTHSLYNYRNPWETRTDLPTWEEFSVFYSKASLELVRIIEEREKTALENLHKKWKAPLLHLNDSQTALVAAFRKIYYDEDPVLGKAIVAFTTHTYGNRRDYPLNEGYGDRVLNFMGIPEKYREFFRHIKPGTGYVYDMASAGLRMSDWQGAVSRAHRDDVEVYDEWINHPEGEALAEYYREVGGRFNLVGVSNGDLRSKTMVYFTEKLRKLYGSDVDVEDLSPEQVAEAKKLAKAELRVSENKNFYSSRGSDDRSGPMLDPDQMVVSYSGRLVPEKAGRSRAFTDNNIEEMVKSGIQVVIYGNVQSNNPASDKLRDDLIALTERLKEKNYEGRLVFVPRFSLNDQRALLAASDVQVQDSHPATEAAGFTEADISACGGIEVGTRRTDNEIGEGLFEAQGIPMDLAVPGHGNVMIPERLDEASYLAVLFDLNDAYVRGDLKYYQATSVRLSRVLEARLTSAAYLRQFNDAIAQKERENIVKEPLKTDQGRERAMTTSGKNSLMAQIYRSDPSAYAAYRVSDYLESSDVENAQRVFFTCEAFQDRQENLSSVADTFNRIIDMVKSGNIGHETAKEFFFKIKSDAMEFSRSYAVAEAVQIMSIQSLSILSWQKRGLREAGSFRITADPHKMVKAGDKERGPSFLSIPRESGINEAFAEGHAGFYWRGIEKLKKLGSNVIAALGKVDMTGSKAKSTVMYAMDHGFVPVPGGILSDTWKGKISTLHETAFINDLIPGSSQVTSTGAGHFQGEKLDVKYVTEGSGIQVNVRYDSRGEIEEVLVHKVSKGDWTLALPGYVDYVINLGGLRFNDFSVSLSYDEAVLFNSKILHGKGDAGMEDGAFLKEIEAVSRSIEVDKAPYAAFMTETAPALLETVKGIPSSRWIGALSDFAGKNTGDLTEMYLSFSSFDEVRKKVRELAENFRANRENSEALTVSRAAENAGGMDVYGEPLTLQPGEKLFGEPTPDSFSGIEGVTDYIESSEKIMGDILSEENSQDRLLRVPVEWIESVGIDNARGVIEAFQSSPRGFVEFYSSDRPEGVKDPYGVVTKDIPEALTASKRTRANTVTLFPVFKGEVLPARSNKRWGGEDYRKSIISPFGFNYDEAGVIRSIILGLRLSAIAEDPAKDENSDFVLETYSQYRELCLNQGEDERSFDLTAHDIVNMAKGDERVQILSLNKLIKLLPIMPFNTEELRIMYNRFKEALIRA